MTSRLKKTIINLFNKKKNIGPPNIDGIEQDKEYYDKIYSEEYPAEKYIPIYKIILNYIDSINLNQKNILDVGCGTGEFANQLQHKEFNNYLGFDFSENAVNQAKNKLPNISNKFIIHNCYNLSSLTYNYNISIMVEVLEHLDDMKIIKQLKSGSYLIGTLPNFWASNNAHLRIYKSKFHIYIRFYKYLKVLKWEKYQITNDKFINIVLFQVK